MSQALIDRDAEFGVLSAFAQFPGETLELVTEESVTAEWFVVFPRHFDLFANMARDGKALNFVTIGAALRDAGLFDSIGGALAVTGLFTATTAGFGSYIDVLRLKFLARQANDLASFIQQTIQDDPANAGQPLIEHIANTAFQLGSYTVRNTTIQHVRPMLKDAVEKLQTVFKNRGHTLGLPTGIHSLDRRTNGIIASHLFFILGRPSHGKSALMAHIMAYIAANTNPWETAECLIFTMEMTALQLVMRTLMSEAGISQHRVRDGLISDGMRAGVYTEENDDWKKIYTACQRLGSSRLHIDTSSNLTVNDIQQRVRRFVRTVRAKADDTFRASLTAQGKTGTDIEEAFIQRARDRKKNDRPDVVIAIDYLQLLRPLDPKAPRYLQIKNDCQVIAALAKDLHIAIIPLAQLKDPENEGADKLPTMADARESGDIEAFAHEMIMTHRPSMYLLDHERADKWCTKHTEEGGFQWRIGTPDAAGVGERDLAHLMKLVIGKNREGPLGVVNCHFEPSLTRFSNWNPREKLFSNNPDEQEARI